MNQIIYKYPKELEAVTLEEVNAAIKKYIDLDKLIIIEAGSLNQDGETTRLILKKQEQKAVSQYTKETAFCISKGYFFFAMK